MSGRAGDAPRLSGGRSQSRTGARLAVGQRRSIPSFMWMAGGARKKVGVVIPLALETLWRAAEAHTFNLGRRSPDQAIVPSPDADRAANHEPAPTALSLRSSHSPQSHTAAQLFLTETTDLLAGMLTCSVRLRHKSLGSPLKMLALRLCLCENIYQPYSESALGQLDR